MTGYLGIDKSNHGGRPFEVFVGVYSTDKHDRTEKLFDMKLDRGKTPVDVLLGGREYRHILIPEDARLLWGNDAMTLLAISELVRHFEKKSEGLVSVLVNGELDNKIIEEAKKLTKRSRPEIFGLIQGDERFPLVNVADSVANALFKVYRGSDGRYNPTNFELKPDVRNYEAAIKRLKKEVKINGQSKGFVNHSGRRIRNRR